MRKIILLFLPPNPLKGALIQTVRRLCKPPLGGLGVNLSNRFSLFFLLAALLPICTYGQNSFSGSFQSNTNFFIRDSAIGASGYPQYDNLKVGTDVWFNLNYTNANLGLEAGVRFDAFLNSILR